MKKTDGKHTPGPWYMADVRGRTYIMTKADNPLVSIKAETAEGGARFEEIKNLIAAAPKMESVLYALLAWHENPDAPDDPWSWARSVLSQVAGGDE